jgi:chorismate synthase
MSFTFKDRISLTIFGSSHGESVGCVLDGIPAGFEVDENEIAKWMNRRAPGQNFLMTQRKEEDKVAIVSGITNKFTDGGPITIIIKNNDAVSKHYDQLKDRPRPGHGDLGLFLKYGPYRNYAGSGFLSGRMTAPLVAAGSIALQILKETHMEISSYLLSIGEIQLKNDKFYEDDEIYKSLTRIPDEEKDSEASKLIKDLLSSGDSVGGIIKTVIKNPAPAMGEPFFDSMESVLSHLMFSIPGLKGIEFGGGFSMSGMRGSQVNDSFVVQSHKVLSDGNHNGGILGGMTYGNPVEFKVAMKPTSSIRHEQKTVNLQSMNSETIVVQGRHDPCIAIRAVPVVKCLTALGLLDLYLRRNSSYKGNFINDSSYGEYEGYDESQ